MSDEARRKSVVGDLPQFLEADAVLLRPAGESCSSNSHQTEAAARRAGRIYVNLHYNVKAVSGAKDAHSINAAALLSACPALEWLSINRASGCRRTRRAAEAQTPAKLAASHFFGSCRTGRLRTQGLPAIADSLFELLPVVFAFADGSSDICPQPASCAYFYNDVRTSPWFSATVSKHAGSPAFQPPPQPPPTPSSLLRPSHTPSSLLRPSQT